MENYMQEILLLATAIAPITTALVQVFKKALGIGANFLPVVGVVIGILLGLAATPIFNTPLVENAWAGLVAGLMSVGLFEFGKGVKKGVESDV